MQEARIEELEKKVGELGAENRILRQAIYGLVGLAHMFIPQATLIPMLKDIIGEPVKELLKN